MDSVGERYSLSMDPYLTYSIAHTPSRHIYNMRHWLAM